MSVCQSNTHTHTLTCHSNVYHLQSKHNRINRKMKFHFTWWLILQMTKPPCNRNWDNMNLCSVKWDKAPIRARVLHKLSHRYLFYQCDVFKPQWKNITTLDHASSISNVIGEFSTNHSDLAGFSTCYNFMWLRHIIYAIAGRCCSSLFVLLTELDKTVSL